jgi:hypothetical protein
MTGTKLASLYCPLRTTVAAAKPQVCFATSGMPRKNKPATEAPSGQVFPAKRSWHRLIGRHGHLEIRGRVGQEAAPHCFLSLFYLNMPTVANAFRHASTQDD